MDRSDTEMLSWCGGGAVVSFKHFSVKQVLLFSLLLPPAQVDPSAAEAAVFGCEVVVAIIINVLWCLLVGLLVTTVEGGAVHDLSIFCKGEKSPKGFSRKKSATAVETFAMYNSGCFSGSMGVLVHVVM